MIPCLVQWCEIIVKLWVPWPLFVRPGQSSCELLGVPQDDFHTRFECLRGAKHPSVGTLGSNSCVSAAVRFAFAFACVFAINCVCEHVCLSKCVCVCLRVCLSMSMLVCACMLMCVCVCFWLSVRVCVCARMFFLWVCMCACMKLHVYVESSYVETHLWATLHSFI